MNLLFSYTIMPFIKPKANSYISRNISYTHNNRSSTTVLTKNYCKPTSLSSQKVNNKTVSDFSKHREESSQPAHSALLKGAVPELSDVESSSDSDNSSTSDHSENEEEDHYGLGYLRKFEYNDNRSWAAKKDHNNRFESENEWLE